MNPHFTSETKKQSKQWTSSGEVSSKKGKHKIGQKGDDYNFWDARGIIHIDYFPSKQMINGDYYVALLDHFNNILKKKTSSFGKEENALSSRQCPGSHVSGTDGQIQRIASPSSIFSPL